MATGRPNYKLLVGGLLLVVPFVILLAVSFGRDPRATPDALNGQPAPAFDLIDMDGNPVSLADFQGKPVVMNFWSTWCGPCKIEHPLLLEAPSHFPNVVFLGVVYQDDAAKARVYLDRAGSAYPHLVDPAGRLAVDYGVTGVPETYFIDAEGNIAYKHKGALSPGVLYEHLGQP